MVNLFTKSLRSFRLILVILLCYSLNANAQVVLKLDSSSGQVNDVIDLNVRVDNFEQLVSSQFTISWDPTKLQFVNVSSFGLPFVNNTNFNLDFIDSGFISFNWYDVNVEGVTVPNGGSIFKMMMKVLSTDFTTVKFTNAPTAPEFTNLSGELLPVLYEKGGFINGALVTGNVYWDMDNNCIFSFGDIPLSEWIVKAEHDNSTSIYDLTSENGGYILASDTGTFVVSVVPSTPFWSSCEDSYEVFIDVPGSTQELNIPVKPKDNALCPYLNVDVSGGVPLKCSFNNYTINYSNKGSSVANGVFIEVNLDKKINFINASIPPSVQQENILVFQIGDLLPGEKGTININASLSCDDILNKEAIEVIAEIFPKTNCSTAPSNWDGVSLKTEAKCENGEVKLTVTNTSTTDMVVPTNQYVIEDDIMYLLSPATLPAGETSTITYPANGKTYRVITDQTANHPIYTQATSAIEGCSIDNNYTTGYYKQFKEDDFDLSIAKDIQEIRIESTISTLAASPKGFDELHYIDRATDIEYTISFNNTVFDTVHNLTIIDTLSPYLNIESILAGASSHPYTWELLDSNIVQFNFGNVNLLDSMIDVTASTLFLKFRISQKQNIPVNTLILNKATVIADNDMNFLTNSVFHIINENYITIVSDNELENNNIELTTLCYPNPFTAYTDIFITDGFQNNHNSYYLSLVNALGQAITTDATINANEAYRVYSKNLSKGAYYVLIKDKKREHIIKKLKILIQ
ncbi:MAG: T9SS type A sorting domain-containing protein [Saprospiraceae bacterium]|nr:T9SS type A sorting domain-containing protein [Saprospiraceae bacterium]